MFECPAQRSLSQEGLRSVSWKTFGPKHINPVLLHVVKIYALASASYALKTPQTQDSKLFAILQERNTTLKQQSQSLARWVNLSDPSFSLNMMSMDRPIPSQIDIDFLNHQVIHATFHHLLYVYLSVQTKEPLLKSLLCAKAHEELFYIQAINTFQSHKTSAKSQKTWKKRGAVFQENIDVIAFYDAVLHKQTAGPKRTSLEALHPYFPPPWIRTCALLSMTLTRNPEFIKKCLEALF